LLHADAASWLRWLVNELGVELGDKAHQPAPIERALIDGTPYRGDFAAEHDPIETAEVEDPDKADETTEEDGHEPESADRDSEHPADPPADELDVATQHEAAEPGTSVSMDAVSVDAEPEPVAELVHELAPTGDETNHDAQDRPRAGEPAAQEAPLAA
jgi:hypothetical protein